MTELVHKFCAPPRQRRIRAVDDQARHVVYLGLCASASVLAIEVWQA
jgi:hypothetical protein